MVAKGKIRFTNEGLKGKFDNVFELVNYAIALAGNMIKTGRGARVKSEIQNPAMLVLQEIYEGEDRLDPIQEGVARQAPSSFDGEQLKELMKEERTERRKPRAHE